MNIYSTVDGKNIDKILVLFNSAYENTENKSELKFYLMIDEFPETIPDIPTNLVDILEIREIDWDEIWIQILEDFNTYFYKSSVWCKSNMNFSRFLFFKFFPEVDRAVYLDWDMIVQGDLFELKDKYDDQENMIVCECVGENIFNNIFTKEFKYAKTLRGIYNRSKKDSIKNHMVGKVIRFLKIPEKIIFDQRGFNAGFYIVSKSHFDENYMTHLISKLIRLQKQYDCFNFGTQVVMNLMHIQNRIFIPKLWNHLPNIDDLASLKIIHWNGIYKPWNCVSSVNEIWWNYCLKIYPNYQNRFLKENLNEFSKPKNKQKLPPINEKPIEESVNMVVKKVEPKEKFFVKINKNIRKRNFIKLLINSN